MDDLSAAGGEAGPEHFLAVLHGLAALLVGAFAWSGAAAVFGPWSLLAAPGLGWVVAWSCRYGGRRTSRGVRLVGWLLPVGAALAGLAALSTFAVLLGSPDAGLETRAVLERCWSLFAAPPWFGSLTVVLVMPGAARALRDPDPVARRAPVSMVVPLPGDRAPATGRSKAA